MKVKWLFINAKFYLKKKLNCKILFLFFVCCLYIETHYNETDILHLIIILFSLNYIIMKLTLFNIMNNFNVSLD